MNFPPEHPLVERVRGICMAYPEAAEVISHGRCTFRGGKRQFAIVGVAHDDIGAIQFIPDPSERLALLEREDVFIPPYEGAYGWLAIRVRRTRGIGILSPNCSTPHTGPSPCGGSSGISTRAGTRHPASIRPERRRGVFWTLVCSRERIMRP